MHKIKALLSHPKYGEIIRFVLTGGATTAVNYLFYLPSYYFIFRPLFSVATAELISNVIGWFFAVLFSFFVTKFFVFESHDRRARTVLYEALTFFAARALSGLIEIPLPSALTLMTGMHHLVAKLAVSVFVVLCNFTTAKFITFRKKDKNGNSRKN